MFFCKKCVIKTNLAPKEAYLALKIATHSAKITYMNLCSYDDEKDFYGTVNESDFVLRMCRHFSVIAYNPVIYGNICQGEQASEINLKLTLHKAEIAEFIIFECIWTFLLIFLIVWAATHKNFGISPIILYVVFSAICFWITQLAFLHESKRAVNRLKNILQ